MIKISVEGSTLQELRDNLALALQAMSGGGGAGTPPKDKPATTKTKDEPAAEEDDGSEGIAYETVSALVVRLSKEKGRDVAINFLKTFKGADKKPATKGAEILPKDYPRAVSEATALLEEEEDVG